ncbi:hypothetical protein [Rothia nasimurium]|uniref:hypothetical protein n=1 Tax=Rothia nasimurium TaxID=85336 RepID=UPI001F190F7F|nr:hypothetical protein [Rothia nasimurium]
MKELKIDDPNTWSQELISFVKEINKKVIYVNSYHEVSWVGGVLSDSEFSNLYEILNNAGSIRAFHYTRLLPHEIEDVKVRGLHIFSKKLFSKKIYDAVKYGFIEPYQALPLIEGCLPCSTPSQNNSRSAICYTTEYFYNESDPDIEHLVKYWGGEGIHFSNYGLSRRNDLLCHLGEPIVVECLVPVVWGRDYVSGNIENQLVLGYRGCSKIPGIEIHQKDILLPGNIVQICKFDEFKDEE